MRARLGRLVRNFTTTPSPSAAPLRVCVVGSGPAGFYTAHQLVKVFVGDIFDVILYFFLVPQTSFQFVLVSQTRGFLCEKHISCAVTSDTPVMIDLVLATCRHTGGYPWATPRAIWFGAIWSCPWPPGGQGTLVNHLETLHRIFKVAF